MRARGGRTGALVAGAALLVGLSACDDQVKRVPWFDTMTEQPAVQTYEERPVPAPEGAVPVDAVRPYTLAEADTMLVNPVAPATELERGKAAFTDFCLPCHGSTGIGDGPVIGPNRLPPIPTVNLTSERARGLSDGYIWGMIENGRGLMPAYRRVPRAERWALVNYVRSLQAAAEGAP
ncbi:MAG: c-type cytochrome [Gemmatimonadota bacterium]